MGPLRFPRNTSNLVFGGRNHILLHVLGIIILEDFVVAPFFVDILRYRLGILVIIFVGIRVRHAQIAIAIIIL